MRLFRRKTKCERRGRHNYGGAFMRSFPYCKDCDYVDPPPVCCFCGVGTYCVTEPIMGAWCCDFCGRSILDTPGSLPSFDNAGSIPLTDEQRARIMRAKERE